MRAGSTFLAVALVAAVLCGQDQPLSEHEQKRSAARERYDAWAKRVTDERAKNAKPTLEAGLKAAARKLTWEKRSVVNPRAPGIMVHADGSPTEYPSANDRRQAIAEAEQGVAAAKRRLADLKAGTYKPPVPEISFHAKHLKVGDTGNLPEVCPIVQVIDKRNMLIQFSHSEEDLLLWLADRSTAGVTDGQSVKISGVLWVSSTKTYRTNLGTKTVFVIEPLVPEPAAP